MDRSTRYQKEAQRRLRLKKRLNLLFFPLVVVPILLLVKADIQGEDLASYISRDALLLWLGGYGLLSFIYYKIWRCPRCEKSLVRLGERFPILRPACRHCGQILFPAAVGARTQQSQQVIRPGFLGSVLFLGAASLGYGLLFGDATYQVIGGSILFLCVIVTFALSRIKRCPHCGHGQAQGAYCEQCGGKVR